MNIVPFVVKIMTFRSRKVWVRYGYGTGKVWVWDIMYYGHSTIVRTMEKVRYVCKLFMRHTVCKIYTSLQYLLQL